MEYEKIYRVCFLVERNLDVGFGHYARCQKIANHLLENTHFEANFLLFGETDNNTDSMHSNFDSAFKFLQINSHLYDILIIDSYSVSDKMLESLRRLSVLVGFIEDSRELSRIKTDFFIKLCSDFQRTDSTYGIPVIGYHKLAKLLQVYPLNKKSKYKSLKNGVATKNIFVSLGGIDTSGEACKILESILDQVHNAVIQYWTLFEDKKIKSFAKKNPSIDIVQGKRNIISGLEWADIAIVSGGNLAHEAFGTGIPTIIVSLIDNQHEITRYYSEHFNVPTIVATDKNWGQVKWLEKYDQAFRSNKQIGNFKHGEVTLGQDLLTLLNNRWNRNCLNVPNFKKIDIGLEYQKHAQNEQDFMANRWGSNASAAKRYEVIINALEKTNALNWLDIGCGTAECQNKLSKKQNIISGVGVEQSTELLARAKSKKIRNFEFVRDYSEIGQRKFDLISCVGVLSKSNLTLSEVMRLSKPHCRPDSVLIIDLPNRDWIEFSTGQLAPDPRHLWFKADWLLKFSSEQKNFKLISCLPFENNGQWLSCSEFEANGALLKASHCNYWMFKYDPD